jgi:hypothetical protein
LNKYPKGQKVGFLQGMVMVYTCNPSTREAENHKLEASLSYTTRLSHWALMADACHPICQSRQIVLESLSQKYPTQAGGVA